MADAATPEVQTPSTEAAPAPEVQEPSNVHELLQQHYANLENKPPEKETKPEGSIAPETAEPVEEGAEAKSEDVTDELDSFVEELFADKPEESDEDDAADDDDSLEIEELGPKSKANKRIRTLSAKAKEAESKAQELETSVAKLTEQTQKQQAVLKKALLKLQELNQPQKQPRQESQADDPVQRAYENLKPLIEQEYGQKLSALQQKLDQYEQGAKQHQEQQQLAQLEAQIRDQAKTYRPQLFPGLPEEAYQDETLGTALDEFLMTRAVGTNRDMGEVAPEVRNFVKQILSYGMKLSRDRGKKLRSNPASPTMPVGTSPTKETNKTPMYSIQQLNQAGYANTFQAHRDGFKRLQGVEPGEGWA